MTNKTLFNTTYRSSMTVTMMQTQVVGAGHVAPVMMTVWLVIVLAASCTRPDRTLSANTPTSAVTN